MTTRPLSPLTMLLSRHTRRRTFTTLVGSAAAERGRWRRARSRQGGRGASASHECRRWRVVSLLHQRRGRPKLAVGYLTLRFTADVFPWFSSMLDRGDVDEYIFAACLRLDKSVALRRIEPLHGAARQFDLPSDDPG